MPVRPKPGLDLVDAQQRADLARAFGGRLDECLLERDHTTLSEDRFEQDERGVGRRGERGLEGFDVVRGCERDPRQERAEAHLLRRLPGHRERSEGAPVEILPSSATIRVLPVAFRAIFSAASFASAPELQKKAREPSKRSARSTASRTIGSVQ